MIAQPVATAARRLIVAVGIVATIAVAAPHTGNAHAAAAPAANHIHPLAGRSYGIHRSSDSQAPAPDGARWHKIAPAPDGMWH